MTQTFTIAPAPTAAMPVGYNAWDYVGGAYAASLEFDSEAEAAEWLAANHKGPDCDGIDCPFVVVAAA